MTIRITHFSDVLCIWAYISQIRVAKLQSNFGDDVAFKYRYFGVFGDIRSKIAAQWSEKGGLSGYAAHVHETAAKFDHITTHPDLWTRNTPKSSMPAHLVLCAAKVIAADGGPCNDATALGLDQEIRRAFFEDAADISQLGVLLDICEHQGVAAAAITDALQSGDAHAVLSSDMKQALDLGVRASPTITFNEGRQTLTGNVGYRVIEANIRELVHRPHGQQTWC